MKKLKDRIEELSLPQETKDRMFDAVIKAGRIPQKRYNMRLIGMLSSAAVLVFVALAAIAVSVISNRSDDMIAEPNENSVSSDQQSAVIIDKKQSSSTEDNNDRKKDTNTSETSKKELESSKSESKISEKSEPEKTDFSEIINDPIVSSPSSYQETSKHEESIEPIEQSSTPVEASQPSDLPETSTENSSAPIESSKPSETSVMPEPHIYERPVKSINVIVPDEIELSEYAGDMHRPEGYNGNIGSGLALKIANNNDLEGLYSVIVKDTGNDFNRMVNEANAKTSKPLDTNDFECITLNGAETFNRYYAVLTKDQVFVLAENGARLSYVGSGAGNIKDINWTTPEGINTFCELLGDMYVFDGEEIRNYPDLYDYNDHIVESS